MATKPAFDYIGFQPVYEMADGSFCFLAGLDVDGDGSGLNLENDPDFQAQTSLRNSDGTSINSRTERGFVVPGVLIRKVPGIVLGCQGRVVDAVSGLVTPAVVHDIGPDTKLGEGTIALASFMGVNWNPVSGGTQEPRFFFQFFPGTPALVNGKQYALQPLA